MADPRYLICCVECADELWEPGSKVYLAMFGPQGQGDEDSVLVCGLWPPLIPGSQPFMCDGGCGKRLCVSPDSMWFVERHRDYVARYM